MMRFEDTPGLFGDSSGASTEGYFQCEFCGKEHNQDFNENTGEGSDYSICITHFAGIDVCEECFERIENEILRRMEDILPWYSRILKTRRANLESNEKALETVLKIAEVEDERT